jgi:5-methylcytosine-specific restriction protein A
MERHGLNMGHISTKPQRKWYGGSHAWKKRRALQLKLHPLCAYCEQRGIVTPATVAHHAEPHKGKWNDFRLGRLESLCKDCHDRLAQREEHDGFRSDIGPDGWPTDPRHRANRGAIPDVQPRVVDANSPQKRTSYRKPASSPRR